MQKNLVDRKKTDFADQVQRLEEDIVAKAEEIKNLVDVHVRQLLDELHVNGNNQQQQAVNLRKSIDDKEKKMKEKRKYLNKQRNTAALRDIGREMISLHDSTVELTNLGVIETAVDDLDSYKVTFSASRAADNIVGKITVSVPTTAGS